MFEVPGSVQSFCNVGGFGIDGDISSLVGASLVHPEKLYIGIVGDLAFFYDMNVVGNRHVGNNIRIMLINNGKGTGNSGITTIPARHSARRPTSLSPRRDTMATNPRN